MSRKSEEIFKKLVDADIGEIVPLQHSSGTQCEYGVKDMLKQGGYADGKEYASVFDCGTCKHYIKKLSPIAGYVKPKHNIVIGDILFYSWGYEQTNIDYYQVIRVTDSTVSIRAIHGIISEYSPQLMSGKLLPDIGKFSDDVILRKTPYFLGGQWYINFDYGMARLWDGEQVAFSSYA